MRHLIWQFRLSLCLICGILLLSLISVPQTSLNKIHHIDKIVHVLLYFGLSITMWLEATLSTHFRSKPLKQHSICIWFPMFIGVVAEVLQTLCTTSRSGDFWDFVANNIGSLLATPLGIYFYRVLRHQ